MKEESNKAMSKDKVCPYCKGTRKGRGGEACKLCSKGAVSTTK